MRVATASLQAVRRGGMLARYHVFGPVVAVVADLPSEGTSGTGLDEPCLTEHHGMVLSGAFSVDYAEGQSETFETGTAFYVPVGPPTHTFRSAPGTVVAGFTPSREEQPVDRAALEALGYSVIDQPAAHVGLPTTVVTAPSLQPFRKSGAIKVEAAEMGPWIFMRSAFGPRSGYTSGWCEVEHWGFVLDGEIAIQFEDSTDLVGRGDAFYAPAGHRFVSADGATIIDYTPNSAIGATRVSRWRRATLDRRPPHDASTPALAAEGAPGSTTRHSEPERSYGDLTKLLAG